MKIITLGLLLICMTLASYAQELTFGTPSPLIVKKQKQDQKIVINLSLKKATKDCSVTVAVNTKSSAVVNNEYVLTSTSPVSLTKDNDYKGKIEVTIKAETIAERMHDLIITCSFKDEKDIKREEEYVINIFAMNDGGADEARLTPVETDINRHLSFEAYAGGNLDFFDHLKFNNLGGEIIINANDITGSQKRIGFFVGVSNFQNFTTDSSNTHVRVQHIRADTGAYVSGKSNYTERTLVDHKKLSISQWSYYINPTYRLNDVRSDFFNYYLSLRLEVLQTSTKTEFLTDTIGSELTNRPLGNSAVFQSGKGFLAQKVVNVQTNGYYSIGFPVFLNAKDKYKVYLDPNLGFTSFSYNSFNLSDDSQSPQKGHNYKFIPFGLFRFRFTEQFSGLNITIGGELRKVFTSYQTTINAYLGIRANISTWFSKTNN